VAISSGTQKNTRRKYVVSFQLVLSSRHSDDLHTQFPLTNLFPLRAAGAKAPPHRTLLNKYEVVSALGAAAVEFVGERLREHNVCAREVLA